MKKIVIGITTHQRNEWLDECIDAIRKHTVSDYDLVVACDSQQSVHHCLDKKYNCIGGEQRGIAFNKNRIIKYAEENIDYSHIFLFDDDAFPIKKGWDRYIINGMKLCNIGHWLFLPENQYGQIVWEKRFGDIVLKAHQNDGGCLMCVPKSTVDIVGGLHPSFYQNKYGGEHSDYARRIARSGLSPHAKISFKNCNEYIDGHDWKVYSGREAMGPPLSQEEGIKFNNVVRNGLAIYNRVANDSIYQPFN
jgi:glycosyltransferase involved in cell wall biosynthesis